MDIEAKIRARRAELDAELESGGLEPHDALLYWGDDSLLFEIIKEESSPLGVNVPSHSTELRSCLINGVIDALRRGELKASMPDGTSRQVRRWVAGDFWDGVVWDDNLPLLEADYRLIRVEFTHGFSDILITGPVHIRPEEVLVADQTSIEKAATKKTAFRKYTDDNLIDFATSEEKRRASIGIPPLDTKGRLELLQEFRANLTAHYLKTNLMTGIRKRAAKEGVALRGRGQSLPRPSE